MTVRPKTYGVAGLWLALAVATLADSATVGPPAAADRAFGCSDGAVGITIDRQPALHFVALDAPAQIDAPLVEEREFHFTTGPLESVVIRVASSGPEDGTWWRGTNVDFVLYAETISRPASMGSEKREHWRLAEGTMATHDIYEPGIKLVFHGEGRDAGLDAIAIAPVAGATVPILHVSYSQNLGGANAENWTENHLLLDFRAATPLVLATSECDYNEGGGACTAIDSSQMTRSRLRCPWRASEMDFLCSHETYHPLGHSDFYLLDEARATPLRSGEVAAMEDAIGRLRAGSHQDALAVRGLGEVHLVTEVDLSSGRWMVVGAPGRLLGISERKGHLGKPISITPRPLRPEEQAMAQMPSEDDSVVASWTPGGEVSLSSRVLDGGDGLSIVQLVVKGGEGVHDVVWLGIEDRAPLPVLDAITVASESQDYAECGAYNLASAVVAVHAIARPFAAKVDVQPAATDEGDGRLVWRSEADPAFGGSAAVAGCVRSGEISWIDGQGFKVVLDDRHCSEQAPSSPQYVRIDDAGTVTLSMRPPDLQEAP